MTKEEFDILVLLEKDRQCLPIQTIASRTGMDEAYTAALAGILEEQGLISDGSITEAGVAALEPYKTKRAIFIAAGLGSRLHPVTLKTPKPLVRVNGKRIIDTLLDGVIAAGIREIYVVCGYLAEQFRELKEKYPEIQLVTNPIYAEANNISSVLCVREHMQNAYVLEGDLLVLNPDIFDKYLYHSSYLGIPTAQTDDWYFKTNEDGVICELGIGSSDCYQMLGISYWNAEDGAKLPEHVKRTFEMPGGRDQDWCYVPLVSFADQYQVRVRECAPGDIEEIDTFEELKRIDPSYRAN